MGIWDFWETYSKALDKFSACKVQEGVGVKHAPDTFLHPRLYREASTPKPELVSRFLNAIRKMPKAWGEKAWTPRQLEQAANNVASETFRRKLKRDLERGRANR